jgi:sigma-E factor negative regulatory protein RseB
MIWLYWRRVRVAVLVTGVAVSAVVAVVIGIAFLAGAGRGGEADTGDGQVGAGWPDAGAGYNTSTPAADATDDHRGLRLMEAAAVACQTVSYRGDQIVSWSEPGGTSRYVIEVWHRPGSPELADGDDDGAVADGVGQQHAGTPVTSGGVTSGGHVVAGVLSVPSWMLALMRSNYVITYSGTGSVIGRPTFVVTLRRRDGALAARYWLDQVTGLPLRRQVFDSSGRSVTATSVRGRRRAPMRGVPGPPRTPWPTCASRAGSSLRPWPAV